MIKNFIFDMGNVLMDFSPDYILSQYCDSFEDVEVLKSLIFENELWHQLDQGTVEFEDACAAVLKDVPERLQENVNDFFATWHLHKVPRTDMLELIKELKSLGYGIYLCSNAAARFHSYKDTYEVFQYFDDVVISADIQISKPDARIYQHVLEKNNLDPKTCYFIDDLTDNIKGAKACGIAGYYYNGNINLLRHVLKKFQVI